MKRENLPVWRALQQLLVQVELAVKGFSRYHKYSIGAELRQSALKCCRLLVSALNSQGSNRRRWVRVIENGFLKGGLKRRVVAEMGLEPGLALRH